MSIGITKELELIKPAMPALSVPYYIMVKSKNKIFPFSTPIDYS
jgi:hypothetical protein